MNLKINYVVKPSSGKITLYARKYTHHREADGDVLDIQFISDNSVFEMSNLAKFIELFESNGHKLEIEYNQDAN